MTSIELVEPESVGFSSLRLQRLISSMQRMIDNHTFAGMLTFASRRSKTFHAQSYGMMDINQKKPMQLDAIFRIYSMTKPITSVAIMMLFEEGCLRLTDSVSRYLPEYKKVKVLSEQKKDEVILVNPTRDITIRDLLTHTSGLSYGNSGISYVDNLYQTLIMKRFFEKPDSSLEEILEALPTIPLLHQPGTAFHYSLATDLLGYLVQIISGIPFETYLKERIFDPLGMVDTAFYVPPEKINRFACNYKQDENGQFVELDPIPTSPYLNPRHTPAGGSGLVSTAQDYLRFMQLLLNKGELDGIRLLSPRSVELMTVNHLPDGIYIDPEGSTGFGLGFSVLLNPAKAQNLGSVGNYGWGGAASTYFWIDPKEELLSLQLIQYMPNTTSAPVDFTNLLYQAMIE